MKTMKTMKQLTAALLWIGVAIAHYSCTSAFDELNTNPDAPARVTPAMLATNVILGHVKSAYDGSSDFLAKRMFWGEQIDGYQYNRFGKGSFGLIQGLTDAMKMVELSTSADKEAYTGLFYYLKGWAFFRTSMNMGDIPYSQALQIETYRYPAYDEQKEVFKGVLNDLALAEEHFANAGQPFAGDPFYQGDPALWRKATNVLRLKVLMSLQKRAEDTPELQVKETFRKIVNEGNLFQGNEENLQVTYSDKDGQKNPLHQTSTKSVDVYAGTSHFIDVLKAYKDYRLFYYFAPMQALTEALYLPAGETLLQRNDWNAYRGMEVAGAFGPEKEKISKKMHCRPNAVYWTSYVGVPSIRLGYADMNFIIAEAAERGWIEASAREHYEKGVKASFHFVRATVPDKNEYTQGMPITDAYIDTYLQGEGVAFAANGSSTDRLKQIWMQSYLASYFHCSWDSYYEYRRTGYPEWPINPETNLNDDKTKIPVRWLYPESESNYNKEQLEKALQRQWGGVENVNKIMWVINEPNT